MRTNVEAIRVPSPTPTPRTSACGAARVREAVTATRWARVHAAVASSRGRQHAVNEDQHSPLDGNAGLFVVADGVGSGALASCASRELVAHVHAVLGRLSVDADGHQLQLIAVQAKRAVVRAVALDAQSCTDTRHLQPEVEVEVDLRHQPVGRAVVLTADCDVSWRGRRFGHGLRVGRGGGADIEHGGGLRRGGPTPQPDQR